MIEKELSFKLPVPWAGEQFETSRTGAINYLVGPNGSGKTRFGAELQKHLEGARLLGTDRLSGMEQERTLEIIFGDNLKEGFPKNRFSKFKQAGSKGSGIDTIVLLEERLDLRIQVESTLGHLFNRKISLEWDSGNLIAHAAIGSTGESYRLDRDECHGIKELLVLLTHLYNDEHSYLIIDEPELNLHPQYQAFFIQEARKLAGDPSIHGKKAIFLITHSPFILDFRSVEDLQSVVSFSLDYSVPRHIYDLEDTRGLSTLIPRLNVHHKQLFFADNPIFVEGVFDAQIVETLQEERGVSIAGAGSCVIDAGGCEEVNKYLELCKSFGKRAYFLYDLDSLFYGNLRRCINDDDTIQSFLATAGLGSNFVKYCGQLDQKLTGIIDQLIGLQTKSNSLGQMTTFLHELGDRRSWDNRSMAKARVAVMTAINRDREALIQLLSDTDVKEVEGYLSQIREALQEENIFLLPGGALEHYLPSYDGDPYSIPENVKRQVVEKEIEIISRGMRDDELNERYGDLYDAVCQLPAKLTVDTEPLLREYLGRYIHELQNAIAQNPEWTKEEVQIHLERVQSATTKVFSIQELNRKDATEFFAIIYIAKMLGDPPRSVAVSHQTNAGMGEFTLQIASSEAEQAPA